MVDQSVIDGLALELLKKLEYKTGDVVSYDDFVSRLHMVANLEGRGESFVSHMFDLVESASFVSRLFKIGERK